MSDPFQRIYSFSMWRFLLLICVLLGLANNSQAATSNYTDQQPARAADFSYSLGVGVHMGAVSGPYGNLPMVVNSLEYFGFKHTRDSVGGTEVGGLPELQQFAQIGVYPDIIIPGDPPAYKSWIEAHAAYIEAIEGPNEVDNFPPSYDGLKGAPAGIALQKAIYAMVKGDSLLANKTVYNLTFNYLPGIPGLGDLAPVADFGNFHAYSHLGAAPYTFIPELLAATVDTPGKPMVVTETGFTTINASAPSPALVTTPGVTVFVNEDVQAKYELDTAFDTLTYGIAKTYFYELFDDNTADPNTNKESHFGLFHTDGSPKPAAMAFHNLNSILADPSTASRSFTPSPLSYSLQESQTATGEDVNQFHVLLQKQDGTHELVLWAEPAIWSSTTGTEVSSVAVNVVTINLDNAYQTIKIYDPIKGIAPIGQYTNANQAQVLVTDHPVIVEISPLIAPSCGIAINVASATAPANNLCGWGSASAVTSTSSAWAWACTSGNEVAQCSAPLEFNGACGSANGTTVSSAPVSGLCSKGTASAVIGNGPWSWSCSGMNGGTTALCSAITPTPVFSVTGSVSQVRHALANNIGRQDALPISTGETTLDLSATVTASAPANNILVDLEIYNDLNEKIGQTFYQGQNFTAGQAHSYNWNFTLPAGTPSGQYIFKVGVFTAGWTKLAYWDNAVSVFGVGIVPPGTFDVTAKTNLSKVYPGSSITFDATVKSTSAANDMLIDLEIYNAMNEKVGQIYYEGQNFTAGQSHSYSWNYKIPAGAATGTYTLKVGVFTFGWYKNVTWDNDAATYTVGNIGIVKLSHQTD